MNDETEAYHLADIEESRDDYDSINYSNINDAELKSLVIAKKHRRDVMKRLKLVQNAVVPCAVRSS